MTKVTRLTLEQGGGLERRRVHLREISDDADAPLETVGQDIRAARQRKGEDLASVSRALKIRKDHLEALEEGNIQALPGRPYAIGFLRSYAEYLGLDPVQCVERFKAEIAGRDEDEAVTPQMSVQDESHLPHGSLILLVLLVIAVVYGGYYLSVSANRLLSEPVTPVPAGLASDAGLQAKGADTKNTKAAPAQTPPGPAVPSSTQATGKQTAAVPPVETPVNNVANGADAAPLAALPPGRVFGIRNGTVRIELRIYKPTRILVMGQDNTVYFNRPLRAGDIFRAPVINGLTLTTPDGGVVEIVLDGASMGFAGKEGKIVEDLPLDPQAIVDHHNGAHSG
jgi:cytoskeleton protein RodZ